MQTGILVAVIGALATLIAATIAHILQRRREHMLRSLQFKLDRYADLLGSFAAIGSAQKTYEARVRIASAVNTMNLIASREVLEQVYSLLDYIQRSESSYSRDEQDAIIRRIIHVIRQDLGQKTSGLKDFPFRTFSLAAGPTE